MLNSWQQPSRFRILHHAPSWSFLFFEQFDNVPIGLSCLSSHRISPGDLQQVSLFWFSSRAGLSKPEREPQTGLRVASLHATNQGKLTKERPFRAKRTNRGVWGVSDCVLAWGMVCSSLSMSLSPFFFSCLGQKQSEWITLSKPFYRYR